MQAFVFFLRHHLWQIFITAANFLSRNTRFLTLGQVFNQSSWKLVQLESTCFKTLKLLKISERCKTGLFMTSPSKVPQNSFQVIYHNQTTIETSTLPIICTFKMPDLILWVIFQNFEWFVSFVVSLTPNWVKRTQSCTSRVRETSKYLMELWNEECFWGQFSNYCSFDSCGDVTNPKLGQQGPKLVFHVLHIHFKILWALLV